MPRQRPTTVTIPRFTRPALLAAAVAVAAASPASAQRAPAPGAVDSFRITAPVLGDGAWVPVFLPAARADATLPVVYLLQRGVYVDRIPAHAALDSVGAGPAIVVGIPDPDALEAFRPGTAAAEAYAAFIADVLIPAVEARYRARSAPEARLALGFSAGGNVLADLAAARPDLFGRVAIVSPGWMFRSTDGGIGDVFIDEAIARVGAAEAARDDGVALWFVWGDGADPWEARSRESGERYVAALRSRGFDVTHADAVPGDHGLALAREGLAPALRFLFQR